MLGTCIVLGYNTADEDELFQGLDDWLLDLN